MSQQCQVSQISQHAPGQHSVLCLIISLIVLFTIGMCCWDLCVKITVIWFMFINPLIPSCCVCVLWAFHHDGWGCLQRAIPLVYNHSMIRCSTRFLCGCLLEPTWTASPDTERNISPPGMGSVSELEHTEVLEPKTVKICIYVTSPPDMPPSQLAEWQKQTC